MIRKTILVRALAILAFTAFSAGLVGVASATWYWERGVNHSELDWKYVETEHFVIYYYPEVEMTARYLYKIAEDIYEHDAKLYNYDLQEKINVVLLDTEDYANGFAMATMNWITLWTSNLYYNRRGRVDWMADVFAHELAHIISLKAAGEFRENMYGLLIGGSRTSRKYNFDAGIGLLYGTERLPTWMVEGVAQYNAMLYGVDLYDTSREMLLRMATLEDHLLTMDQMDVIYDKISLQAEMVYNQGFSLNSYIGETWGLDAPAKMWHESGLGFYPVYNRMVKKELGVTREELYEQWKKYLVEKYEKQVKDIKGNEAKGRWRRIFDWHPPVDEMTDDDKWLEGQANYYFKYSPDGEYISLASSHNTDGGYRTTLYIKKTHPDPEEINDGKIIEVGRVSGTFSWSPDSKMIVYAQHKADMWTGHYYMDLFIYDLESETSEQITHGLRATNPTWNPESEQIAFIINKDGSQKLAVMRFPGLSGHKLLIDFDDTTQIDLPVWSPDGTELAFVMYRHSRQDIWTINADGTGLTPVTYDNFDNRDPAWDPDGKHIFFSSDRTGIFNIYKIDLESHGLRQITDVLGGALYPSLNPDGSAITYSYFTSWGFRPYEIHRSAWKNKKVEDFEFTVTAGEVRRNLETPGDLPEIAGRDYRVYDGFAQLLPIWKNHRGRWLWIPMADYNDARLRVGAQMLMLDPANTNEIFSYVMVGEEQRYSLWYSNFMTPVTLFASLHRIFVENAEDFDFFDFNVKATFDVSFYYLGASYLLFGEHDVSLYYGYADYRVESPSSRNRQITSRGINFGYYNYEVKYAVDSNINPRGGGGVDFNFLYASPKMSEPITGTPMGTDLADFYNDPAVISIDEARHYPDEDYLMPDYGYSQVSLDWKKHMKVWPWWDWKALNDWIPIAGWDWQRLNLERFQRKRHALTLKGDVGFTHSTIPEGYGYGNSFGRVHYYDRFVGGGMYVSGLGAFSDNTPFLGYESYSLAGETKAMVGFDYRFPLIREIDKQYWAFYFDKLYFSFFGNTGNYWSHVARRKDMFNFHKVFDKSGDGKFSFEDDVISDAGIELRMNMFLFSSSWNSFIKVAHGFQDRENDERPFRFYVGLGTGFGDWF